MDRIPGIKIPTTTDSLLDGWPFYLCLMENAGIFKFFRPKPRMMPARVLLVDDHAIVLEGIRRLLDGVSTLKVERTFTSGHEALKYLERNDADLLITDYNLPGIDGLAMIRAVRRVRPDIRVIVLSMHNEVHLVKEILRADVNGYVLKNDSHKELLDAIEDVMESKLYLSSDISKMLVQDLQNPNEGKLLTDREREVLTLIAKEYSNKQIAEELFISERTVETHRKNIFRKTGTNSLVGLIKFAYANNLI
jgi:DNA-binding NarL/FixJ family response regulator